MEKVGTLSGEDIEMPRENKAASKKGASKSKTAKRKGGGSKLTRTEIVQVRLDPKLRFTAELAAKKHRRTLSSFIEWAIAESVENVRVGLMKTETASYVANTVWDKSKVKTFINLVKNYPYSLTHDEEQLWHLLVETEIYWRPTYESYTTLDMENPPGALRIPEKLFDQFLECAKGKLEKQELIRLIRETIKKLPKIEAKEYSRRN